MCATALVAAAAVIYALSLRAAVREVAAELDEKLHTDTNTQISVSSGSHPVRALAADMNRQLGELRRERLRLQNGDAELKNAVTNVSHDLRTPLTAICGYLDLLEEEKDPEKARRYIAVIRERADAMRALTDELLGYSVVAGASDAPDMDPVNIGDVLEESLAGFYGVFSARGITPEIHMPQVGVVRMLDAAALRRVFDNILGNAAKYSDGDLSVTLLDSGTVLFSNAAAGLGHVRAERLFDRFYTVESATGGVGLGLSIAKMLTERMGGSIGAEYSGGRLCIRLGFE